MLDQTTNWPRLYATAAAVGAGFGLLLSMGGPPLAPDWPAEWSAETTSLAATLLVPMACGALIAVALVAVAHLGVRWQLRRRPGPGPH